jgi:UDP-2,4-diacetamido-2,4,6-trideoxy-beta-L-altropyranose hydrolase
MRILIRTDGSPTIGTGHVMRMLALARAALERDISVSFLCAELDTALERRLRSFEIPVERIDVSPGSPQDARSTLRHYKEQACDWLVADSYAFGAGFQEAIRNAHVPLLLLDDYRHADRYSADIVLNQNLTAEERLYANRAPQTRLLLGPSYALLQPEFFQRRVETRAVPDRARQLLVTMGGADPVNATEIVMNALSQYPEPSMRARVIIGATNSRAGDLANATDDSRLELLVGVEEMIEHMRWADLAISAAGTTLLELCFMQVPTILVTQAPNQASVARAAVAEGLCESAGWYHEIDVAQLADQIADLCRASARRRTMTERTGERVDGLGATRVLDALLG